MRKLAWRLALAAVLALTWSAELEAADTGAVLSTEDKQTAQPIESAVIPAPSVAKPTSPAPSMDDLGRVLGYTVLVACLAFLSYYFIKHGLPIYRARNSEEKKLHVLEMKSLGNRQFLLVVGYEDQRLLLGVTPGKIDYLCPLDVPHSVSPDFDAILAKATKQEGQA
jgi:flagellar biogenesis protein FliO